MLPLYFHLQKSDQVNLDRKALFIRRKVVLGKIDLFKLPEPTALKNVLIV